MFYAIGTVKGPGETGNQYVFITSDNRNVRIGEFVFYEVLDPAQPPPNGHVPTLKYLQILGKISDRRLIDHLPDRIFADTEINPEAIAALVGFADPNPAIYEVTVDVVGYFDQKMGFVNPRQAPQPGTKVCLADDAMLQKVLNKRVPGAVDRHTLVICCCEIQERYPLH